MNNKIIKNEKTLLNMLSNWRGLDRTIVAVNGCFDILHIGHIRFLQYARFQGDVLLVGLNSDESVKANKGELRPIFKQNIRAEMLAALDCVSFIYIFSEKRPDYWLKIVRPNILVKSSQYERPDSPSKILVESYGGKVAYFKDIEGYSTTNTIERIIRNE